MRSEWRTERAAFVWSMLLIGAACGDNVTDSLVSLREDHRSRDRWIPTGKVGSELEVEAWDLRLRNTGRVNDKDT
jgi:hypothetical protein